mmetsp:Transcript_87034/g.138052  ORF Transcript_87034/g.138052 Transcript_87034/m.138052 type:complete len:524 (-) Transcript_87034:120-1691(-)
MRALLLFAHVLGLLGQECEIDSAAALQTARAAEGLAYNSSKGRSNSHVEESCEDINIPIYTTSSAGGGSFAVANSSVPKLQCGRAEGNTGDPSPEFCQCSVKDSQAHWGSWASGPTTGEPNWDKVLPGNQVATAERCFRAGTIDPDIRAPPGYDFSCADPRGKTERDPHRSCRFTHYANFPVSHKQEVPANTQIVGLCYQPFTINNPVGTEGWQTDNARCKLFTSSPVPSVCSSEISTFQLPAETVKSYTFLLKCCDPPSAIGIGDGDPHIHSLRGAHYTLLRQGNFLAWNFSKPQEGVHFELFASYGGPDFTTQALLLKSGSETMEFTAKDCLWKTKVADGWSLATHQSSESSQVRVQPTRQDHSVLSMKTGVLLYNQNQRKVAKLMTHCAPNHHLDYKLIMMDKANLDFVGGELGTSPEHIKGVALLSNLRVSKKADEEFKVGPWLALGGSSDAAHFLDVADAKTSFLEVACGEVEEQAARDICSNHVPAIPTELLADCIMDVCYGGGEAAAQSLAGLLQD